MKFAHHAHGSHASPQHNLGISVDPNMSIGWALVTGVTLLPFLASITITFVFLVRLTFEWANQPLLVASLIIAIVFGVITIALAWLVLRTAIVVAVNRLLLLAFTPHKRYAR